MFLVGKIPQNNIICFYITKGNIMTDKDLLPSKVA